MSQGTNAEAENLAENPAWRGSQTPRAGGPKAPDHIFQFFSFSHLPPPLREVARPFAVLADQITETLPRNPERTVALRKLLEAKDAAVRAFIAGA